ncbi:phospholipid scramblase 4-like isoform X2 [Herpailurus yagouaroundi]|uniref:phospholipid scramblase 4-like isoform X2 n=1 Tax=Herpailurus yagouaroundi TaxID=1608482 RepID=UPI001AD79260|nr:phospholipid scramblase 4-like isoform X2 [Puma yagouaroundi]
MPEPVPVPNCPPGLEDLVAQLEMQWPPGVTAGFALEHWNPCRMLYSIQSKKKEKVMGVRGPRSTHGWGSDSAFEVDRFTASKQPRRGMYPKSRISISFCFSL